MASSTRLRPQTKKQQEFSGILKNQELNKVTENSRSKPLTTHLSKRGSENQDPSDTCNHTKGVNKIKGVSKLPVLAKSLQTVPTDICHMRWEEGPLLGKAQKRKTCTKPIPFGLSKAWNCNQMSAESVPGNTSRSWATVSRCPRQETSQAQGIPRNRTKPGTTAHHAASHHTHKHHPNNTATEAATLSRECHANTASELDKALSASGLVDDRLCNEMATTVQRDLSTQMSSITLACSELASVPSYSVGISGKEVETDQAKTKGSIHTPLSANCRRTAGVCGIVESEEVDSRVFLPQRLSVKKKAVCSLTEAMMGNAVAFSPDPAALRSILLNEGVKAGGLVGGTPRASVCPSGRGTSIYSARRVPVRKPEGRMAAEADGTTISSPEPSALRNILLNEGGKVGGNSVGVTPRVSVFPTGRGTSVYSAQRVPIKKAQTETATTLPGSNAGAVSFSPDPASLHSILLNEGVKVGGPVRATPQATTCPSARGVSIYSAQRVPVNKTKTEGTAHVGASRTPSRTRTQQRGPHSQRRLISAHKTPFFSGSPGLNGPQALATDCAAHLEECVVQRLFQEEPEQEETGQLEGRGNDAAIFGQVQEHHTSEPGSEQGAMDTDRHCSEKQSAPCAVQPFIQAAHRQSVIVFSSGRKPLKPALGRPADPAAAPPTPQHAGQKESSTAPTSGSQSAPNPDANKAVMPTVPCTTKGFSLAVCALRRRLPPLEEMFLDDECATYTSGQQSRPTQPRCTNPIASMLLFHDSTCFEPIAATSPNHLSLPARA